jgi:hypothetical protein
MEGRYCTGRISRRVFAREFEEGAAKMVIESRQCRKAGGCKGTVKSTIFRHPTVRF